MMGTVLARAAKNPFPCEPRDLETETSVPPKINYTTYLVSSFIKNHKDNLHETPVPYINAALIHEYSITTSTACATITV